MTETIVTPGVTEIPITYPNTNPAAPIKQPVVVEPIVKPKK